MLKIKKYLFRIQLYGLLNLNRQFYNFSNEFDLHVGACNTERSKNLKLKTVASIQNKAKELLQNLQNSKSNRVSLIHLENLVDYLKVHTFARQKIYEEYGVSIILNLRETTRCRHTIEQATLALALLGYVDPIAAKGIRILSLDGGGSRGVMTIEMLKKIEDLCKQPIHQLFDLIVGTSTGAILAFLIGIQKKSLDDCKRMYERLSTDIFDANSIVGAGKLFLNHAYYDTEIFEDILKSEVSANRIMIDTAATNGPKVAAVSTVVNEPALQPFIFRNYCFHPNHKNIYMGTSKHALWQAVRASTAAPGYFQEFLLDGFIHQDGAILTNNPCSIAIHEAKTLWPNSEIQAIISIGTGVYHGRASPHTTQFTTLREKLSKIVASATDVEAVHIALQDLLPPSQYIRLNPNMSNDVPLDENRLHVLRDLEQDTRNYIEKFSHKYDAAAFALLHRKTFPLKIREKFLKYYKMKGHKLLNNPRKF